MISNRRRFLLQSLAGFGWLAGAKGSSGQTFDASIIGSSTSFPGYSLDRAIEAIRQLGFQTIEIHPTGVPNPKPHLFPGFQFDRLSEPEKHQIKSTLAGFRHVSTHLPWVDLHYFSSYEPIAEFSVRQIDIALEASAYIGAEIATLHAQSSALQTLEQAWPVMIERFRRWGNMAKKGGFRLAIETGYPRSVRDYVRLIQEVDHDYVGATVDVGHQNRFIELVSRIKPEERGTPKGIKAYNDLTVEIIDRLGPKVFHLHVHDIEPDTWKEHKPLYYGFVDYPRLIRTLRRIDYKGLLVFELRGPASEKGKYLTDSKRTLEKYLAEAC